MAFTDYTCIDGSQYKKPVQVFVSAHLKDIKASVTQEGLVLGYLPAKSLILGVGRIDITTAEHVVLPEELTIGGNQVTQGSITGDLVEAIEVQGDITYTNSRYIVIFTPLTRTSNEQLPTVQPAIASDGTVAVRRAK